MAQTIQQDDIGNGNANKAGNQQQVGIFPPNQQGGQAQPAGGNQNASGNGQQAQGANYNPNQQKGTGYTNIQRVLQANTGNQLGQAVGQGIQQAGQQTQQALGQQQQQFQQQTGQAQFNTDANNQLIQRGLSDPTSLSPQEQQQFQTLISGQYQGPQGLANTNQLQAQAANVGQLTQGLGTAGGRMGVLQQIVGNPQYTQGQAGLDQLLLGKQGGGALAQAKQAVAKIPGQINQATQGAQAQGQEQTGQAQGFGTDTQGKFGTAVTNLNQQLTDQATKAQSQRDADYQKAVQDLQSGTISQKEADLLGLSAGQQLTGNALSNVGQFLTEDPTKASAQNIASAQQYATIDALRKLGGNYSPQDAQAILGQYSGQNDQAGKFAANPAFTADKSGFQSAANAQMQNYQSQLAPSQTKMQSMQELNDLYNQQMAANRAGNQQQAIAIDQQIRSKFPGAVGGDFAHNVNWARQQLEQATQGFNATRNALQQQFGGLHSITITPEEAAAQADQAASGGNASIQPVNPAGKISIMPQSQYPAANAVINPNNPLEKMPTVS